MGVSNSTPNSIIVRKYSEGNCDKLIDDYKITSIKNKAEDEIYPKNDETPGQTPSNSTENDSQKEKEEPKSNKNILHVNIEAKDSKETPLSLDDENLTKAYNYKEDSKEILGRKTKNPRRQKQQKKGKDNVDIISGKFESDNWIKQSIRAFILRMNPMIGIWGNITLENFNCNDILGGVKQNKLIRKANLYQILGYKEEYRKILRNAKPKNAEKFNYFLSSNFGFLFDKYFLNDRKFNINGKEEEVLEFKTLNDEIKRRRKHEYKEYEEKEREERINIFIYSSYLVFNDFKDCESGEVKAEKGLIDYTQNRIEKFFIYAKKKKKFEPNIAQEKEKFLNLINKTNEELNNDNTLKSEFSYFEEKEKGFEQFMTIKKIIEEKEKKRNENISKKKKITSKDSNPNPNLKVKFIVKKKKIKKKETKVFNSCEELNFLQNFAVNDKNLEQNYQEQKENFEQEKFIQEPNSIGSKNSKIESLELFSDNSHFFNNYQNSSHENINRFEETDQDNLNVNNTLPQSFSWFSRNNDNMCLNKNEEYLFERKFSDFWFSKGPNLNLFDN